MQKILIITYYWPPSGGAGVQRWVKFAKYLPEFGFEPIVLTVDPKYASYPVLDESLKQEVNQNIKVYHTKSLEPYNLYKKYAGKGEIPQAGFANESEANLLQKVSRFIRGNLFIPDARIGWNKYAFKKAIELIEKYDIDTVVTTSPPHSTQLIGLKLKKKLNLRWIADLRDPWTNIYYYDKLYHTDWAKKRDSNFEKKVLQNADHIVVVSPSIKNKFAEKIDKASSEKISIISNGFDEDDFHGIAETKDTKTFTITYTGTLAANYGIKHFLEAVEEFYREHNKPQIRLRFVGVVASYFKDIIKSGPLKEITSFEGHLSHEKAVQFMLQSNMLLLAIPNVSDNEGILTGKLFEYLATNKPVIGVGPVSGDASKILEECKAGEMFGYTDKKSMLAYLSKYYTQWKKNEVAAENLSLSINYSRRNLSKRFTSLLTNT